MFEICWSLKPCVFRSLIRSLSVSITWPSPAGREKASRVGSAPLLSSPNVFSKSGGRGGDARSISISSGRSITIEHAATYGRARQLAITNASPRTTHAARPPLRHATVAYFCIVSRHVGGMALKERGGAGWQRGRSRRRRRRRETRAAVVTLGTRSKSKPFSDTGELRTNARRPGARASSARDYTRVSSSNSPGIPLRM